MGGAAGKVHHSIMFPLVAGAQRVPRMARTVVGAPGATGALGISGAGAGRNCLGVVGLGKGGERFAAAGGSRPAEWTGARG